MPKKKKPVDIEAIGSPRLGEEALEDDLVLQGTMDGSVDEDAINERLMSVEADLPAKSWDKEIAEAMPKKKAKKSK